MALLKSSREILQNDAHGRLKLIGWMHDFENIDENIEEYQDELSGTGPPVPVSKLVKNAFFPKLQMKFSERENPLDIVAQLERYDLNLKKEMLYFQQNIDQRNLNSRQVGVLGGYMSRTLAQMPIERKINMKLADQTNEDKAEFMFFQKLLVLSREFKDLDLKDFSALASTKIEQTDNQCFKIAQQVFSLIEAYRKNIEEAFQQARMEYEDKDAILQFGLKMKQTELSEVQRQVTEMEEQIIVNESLKDLKQSGKVETILSSEQITTLKNSKSLEKAKVTQKQKAQLVTEIFPK